MGAKLRSEIFRPEQQAIVHVMNRCVRKSFLMGRDKTSGKDYGHRRKRFERELRKAAAGFAIDMLSYAIMDNHFHLILRSRPDIVRIWTDLEIVKQWHKLWPIFRDKDGFPIDDPSDKMVAEVAQDLEKVARWRKRLSDISWLMKLVSQKIAKWCNAEDGVPGHFWGGRFKAILLLDERALLACSMYVDLNRIQAELAASIEDSDYTSVQRRLQAFAIRTSMRGMMTEQFSDKQSKASIVTSVVIDHSDRGQEIPEATVGQMDQPTLPDAHLSPIQIDEKNDPIGPHISQGGSRCSDKGFLPMSQEKYIELLRWTADQIRHKHDGQTFEDSPSVLSELQMQSDVWCKLTTQFTELFFAVAGMPESVDAHRSCGTNKRFHMPQKTREMLSA